MLIAIDTNILVYAEGLGLSPSDAGKPEIVRHLLSGAADAIVISLQVLGEFHHVARRKSTWSPAQIGAILDTYIDRFRTASMTLDSFRDAAGLTIEAGLSVWDAMHLAVASDAGAALFLSEDLQHGFRWRDVTVVNPFHPDAPKLLAPYLS